MSPPFHRFPRRAFTLIEVLLATAILGFAAFGLMGLLRLSDRMSYQGKLDARVAQIARSRVGVLISIPFVKLRDAAATGTVSGPNTYEFQRGDWSGNTTAGFPFAEDFEPGGSYTASHYLASGKPLPGTSSYRGIFKYTELITLQFPASPGSSRSVAVSYTLAWEDPYNGGTQTFNFDFTKYDPIYY